MHYDNPQLVSSAVVNDGFRVYYSDSLRPNDVGSMIIGDPVVALSAGISGSTPFEVGDLPSQRSFIHRQGTCPGACTASLSSPMNVFGVFHHMHNYGHKIVTEKYDVGGTLVGQVGGRVEYPAAPESNSEGGGGGGRIGGGRPRTQGQGEHSSVCARLSLCCAGPIRLPNPSSSPRALPLRSFWDNGFQSVAEGDSASFVVQPGESLQTHCYYNTEAYSASSSIR